MGGFNDDLMEGFISNSRIWIIIKPDEFLELEVRQHGDLKGREGGYKCTMLPLFYYDAN